MKQLTETHKAVLIFAAGNSTTLTAAKIHQTLSDTEHIILNLQQLIRCKTEVMLAWKIKFDVLVLESDSSAEVSADLFNELSGFLNGNVAEKKFIFISNSFGNIQQIHELRNIFSTNLTEKYDDFKFTDIVTESRMLFLNKKVSFQGREVKLSTIVNNNDVRLLNALDCDSISLLLENKKPSIGMRTEDTVKYYIDRTLQCRQQTDTCFPAQGEIQHASSGDILQDVRDSSSHLEVNCGGFLSHVYLQMWTAISHVLQNIPTGCMLYFTLCWKASIGLLSTLKCSVNIILNCVLSGNAYGRLFILQQQ
jgi:hypothetical protein